MMGFTSLIDQLWKGPGNLTRDRGWGIAVTLVTLALVMTRLGQASLWADESYTGLLGASILQHGLPRPNVGLIEIHWLPGDTRDGLWVWDGWLQHYLSAAGEAIFGRTALGARFFHALAGALIPWAVYPLFRAMSDRRGVAEAATLLTGLSVALLILTRQARYYPEGTLLTIFVLRAYYASLTHRPRAAIALVVSSVLLFHSNVLWFALVGAALAVHLALVRPALPIVGRIAGAVFASGLLVLPFALWARVWARQINADGSPMEPKDFYLVLAHLRHFLLELHLHAAPIWALFLGGAVASGRRRPLRAIVCVTGAILSSLVLSGPHTALVLIVFAATAGLFAAAGLGIILTEAREPQPRRGWMPGILVGLLCASLLLGVSATCYQPYFRYLAPLLPFAALLAAQSIFRVFNRPWLAWTAIALLIWTSAASTLPIRSLSDHVSLGRLAAAGQSIEQLAQKRPPAWLRAPSFAVLFFHEGWRPEAPPSLALRSPLRDYLGEITHSFQGPIDALVDYLNAHKKPGDRFLIPYGAYPVAYHTGMAPMTFDPAMEPPRWVIFRADWRFHDAYYFENDNDVRAWIGKRHYRRTTLDAIDMPYQNREEPDLHLFRTARNGPPVVILERVE